MTWIKCEERLPNDMQKVLAFNDNFHIATFNENPGEGIGSIWESQTENKEEWGLREITHWMPLKPPEAQE